ESRFRQSGQGRVPLRADLLQPGDQARPVVRGRNRGEIELLLRPRLAAGEKRERQLLPGRDMKDDPGYRTVLSDAPAMPRPVRKAAAQCFLLCQPLELLEQVPKAAFGARFEESRQRFRHESLLFSPPASRRYSGPSPSLWR